jgi:hypothetical protein
LKRIWAPAAPLLLGVFACLGASVGGSWLLQGLYQLIRTNWTGAWVGDAAIDHAAAKLFWRGISPYTPEGLALIGVSGFGHPPTTPFWFLPLTAFEHAAMAHFVALANLAMLIALVATAVFTLRFPLPLVTTLVIVGYVQNSLVTFDHNVLVQLSMAIAFATVLGWKYLRDGKELRGGAALGLACTLKPFPGVLVLLLLLSGRFRAVAAAVAAFFAVASVMTWRWGISAWRLFFEQQDAIARSWIDTVRNASLQGIVRRLLKPRCDPAVIDETTIRWATLAACLFVLGACVWIALRAPRGQIDRTNFDLKYALFCVLGPFINPWVWEHYVFILILPMLVVARTFGEHFVASFRQWAGSNGGFRPAILMLTSAAALVPLAVIPGWTQVTLYVNQGATQEYCEYSGPAEVKRWLLRRAQYFELTSWLPWAITLVLLALLLLLRFPRRGASRSSTSGVARALGFR